MTTLELAKKKYADKMGKAGPVWKAKVTDKTPAYAKGMAEFLGIADINTAKKDAYESGIERVTADDFAKAVAGKEAKWADKLKAAFL